MLLFSFLVLPKGKRKKGYFQSLYAEKNDTPSPPQNWPPSSQPCTALKSQQKKSLGEMAGDFPSGDPRFFQAVTTVTTVLRHGGNIAFSTLFGAAEHPKQTVLFCRNSPPDFTIFFKARLIKMQDSLQKKKGEMKSLPAKSDQSRSQLAAQCVPQPHCKWQRLGAHGSSSVI